MREASSVGISRRYIAVIGLIGMLLAPFSSAQAASVPSVGKVASKLEKRYNINGDSVRDVMQGFNVNSSKKTTPEVSVFFSPSDPKSGEKITARAMPIYFSNPSESLYYTWYLKRKDCNAARCDYNGDGAYNSKDWRIEAASILVQNGYDSVDPGTSYIVDDDNDGYKARFGGDNKEGKADYCAVYDPRSGDVYELVDSGSSVSFSCPAGLSATCLEGETQINPETSVVTFGGGGLDIFGDPAPNSGGGTITPFSETPPDCNVGGCSSVGAPVCSGGSVPTCTSGTPCCVADPVTATVCAAPLNLCSATTSGSIKDLCTHVFAQPRGGLVSGDGAFGAGEESFWKTNPRDPSTANNGQKDEATVVGLGMDEFSWTYFSGDEVGVAVEGTSMIPTKHDDSSSYVMWAFPKNKCHPSLVGGSTSQYVQSVKSYLVTFPTADMDPNDCISHNLVNPAEGGQSSNLSIQLSVSPGSLTNDETSDKSGDIVTVQAAIDNASRENGSLHYDWIIDISDNPRFTIPRNITAAAINSELTTRTKGNDLGTLHFKMNIPAALLGPMSGGTGYIRFRLRAEESIEGGGIRKGNSEVIARFVSTGKRIQAYLVDPVVVGPRTHVKLGANMICNGSPLERTACQVIKNEVIGLKIDGAGLRDFSWQINQKPLICNRVGVSPDCSDTEQGNIVFFPVTGKTGDSYEVTVTAVNTATDQAVTMSRLFYVIDPYAQIVSSDTDVAWKKLLGFYRDVLGTAAVNCPAGLCPNYSEEALQTFAGSVVVLKAEYLPRFIASHPGLHTEWRVDGEVVEQSATDTISFPIRKYGGASYDISFQAIILQTDLMRRALYDVWDISPLDSTESNFTGKMQVEVQDATMAAGDQKGIKKYYALISSYVPETFLFTFRVLLLGFLALFVTSFFGSLVSTPRFSRRR